MRRSFLGLGAILVCACGGSDTNILGGDGGDEGSVMPDGGGGGDADAAPGDACMAIAEICGDMADNDCDGVIDNGCKMLGTYVSGATGVDTNPGTKAMPVKTIAQGIKNAQAIGGKLTVYVGNSHYPEKITLVEGISLEGGYHCDMMTCDWMRNPPTYDTAILNPDFEGVLAPSSITRATKIDGFRLQGMNGAPTTAPGSAAITVLGSPTITGNRINGADISGGMSINAMRSSGVAILAPITDMNGPLVENNDIQGGAGTGTTTSVGVLMFWQNNPPPNSVSYGEIRNNRIKGGSAPFTWGIDDYSSAGSTAIVGNSIVAGTAIASNAGSGSFAVRVWGTALIDSNLMNSDQNVVGTCTGLVACGGLASLSSTTTITNNIIYGMKAGNSIGVYLTDAEKPVGVVILNGNVIDGAGAGLGGNPTRSSAVFLHINNGNNSLMGRIRNNVLLGGTNLFRYGVYEDQVANKTNKPEKLEYNQFYFAPLQGRTDSTWHQWNGTVFTDSMTAPAMNQLGDPLLDATWHLLMNSPCLDKGINTEAPAKDRDGDSRPKGMGYDIGADEK